MTGVRFEYYFNFKEVTKLKIKIINLCEQDSNEIEIKYHPYSVTSSNKSVLDLWVYIAIKYFM